MKKKESTKSIIYNSKKILYSIKGIPCTIVEKGSVLRVRSLITNEIISVPLDFSLSEKRPATNK